MVGSRISLPFLAQPGFGLQEPREKRLLRRFATYYFSKSFVLAGQPTSGTDYLSADDFAELRVNGVVAGSVGSSTDIGQAGQAQTALTAFDVTPLLKPGSNVITVKGQNGPPTFSPFCGTTCTYAQNVAGVVFGGTLSYVTASALVDAVSPELVLVDCELARRARMLLPDADDTLALPRSTRSDPEATLTPPAMILPDAGDTLALPAKATSGKPRVFPVSFPDNGSFLETRPASDALERMMEHAVESEGPVSRASSRRHGRRVTTLIPTSSAAVGTALLLVQLYLGAGSFG